MPEYEVVKLARQATRNPGKRARKEAAYMVWDMAAALQFMPKEDAMALLAAAGVPFDDALVLVQAGEAVEQAA